MHSIGRDDTADDELVPRLLDSPFVEANLPNFAPYDLIDSGSNGDVVSSGSELLGRGLR